MRPTVPSLGERLQRAGLIDAASLEALLTTLRDRLRTGMPTSLGRLLIERGIASTRILAVATSGDRPAAIRCDACSQVQPVAANAAREFPCARCGAFLLPLGPSPESHGSTIIDAAVLPLPGQTLTPALPNPAPNEDTTMPLGMTSPLGMGSSLGARSTGVFDEVLPIPGPAPDSPSSGGTTHNFDKVLPLPGQKSAPAVVLLPSDLPGTEDPTVALQDEPSPPPPGLIGIPPTIHTRPAFPVASSFVAGIPPVIRSNPSVSSQGVPQGIPPVIQDPRIASSSVRRNPNASREFGVNTETPTVADAEGSGGAFAEAAPLAGSRNTTVDAKNPLASRDQARARSGPRERAAVRASPWSNRMIAFIAFALTLFVAGVASLLWAFVFAH